MQVFHNMARTRAALRSKEFFRVYTGPSDSIISGKSPKTSKFRSRFHQKPKKPFSYQIEYEKLRGLRESEEELAKVQAYIDRMIAKNIKKFEDEKKLQEKFVKIEYHYPTLQELVSKSSPLVGGIFHAKSKQDYTFKSDFYENLLNYQI